MPARSVIPYLVLMALYLLVARRALRFSRFYDRITSSASRNRFQNLDGLRGILALGVFFHHAVITQASYVTGKWETPPGFYGKLGPTSVVFFFMITGFLFWSKAIHSRERIKALALWRNRILRIAPMCLFTVFVMLAMAAAESRFRLCEPVGKLAQHVTGCLLLGVMLPNVNGISLGDMNANVFWTLRYEWGFYIAFPLLAFCATPRKLAGVWIAAALLALAVRGYMQDGLIFCAYFLLGMTAAQWVASEWLGRFFRSRAWPLLTIGLLAALAAGCPTWCGNQALRFVVFLVIAYDSDLFAFLRWQSMKFLGTISYSVYLIHGIVLYSVFHAVNHVVSAAALGPQAFWGIACACGLLTILISAVTYRWIEHPFISRKRSTAGTTRPASRDFAPVLAAGVAPQECRG